MSDVHGIARDQLRAFVERIERLEEEKKSIADDIKEVYSEAKAMGFDPKIMKKLVSLRKKDEQERQEEEMVLATYMSALGMIQADLFAEERPTTREDRAKRRTSEAMDDHKALIDEIADAGLISEEAREENKRLADAVATKFGAGIVKPSAPIRSDGGTRIIHKHTNIKVSDGSPAVPTPPAESEDEEISASILPETATETQHSVSSTAYAHAQKGGCDSTVRVARTEAAAVTDRRDGHLDHQSEDDAFVEVKGSARLADATGVEPSSSEFNPMEIARPQPKTARDFRPHCLRPAACGASGLDHCYSCKRELAKTEEFA